MKRNEFKRILTVEEDSSPAASSRADSACFTEVRRIPSITSPKNVPSSKMPLSTLLAKNSRNVHARAADMAGQALWTDALIILNAVVSSGLLHATHRAALFSVTCGGMHHTTSPTASLAFFVKNGIE